MRATFNSAAAVLSAISLASAQTFTSCNPTLKSGCSTDPAIGSAGLSTDFTKVSGTDAPKGWEYAAGTSMSYDSTNGANFKIDAKTGAPTVSTTNYIMFGKVTTKVKASPGTGIVSSFILESDDLDEIDWEWLGSTDTSVESNFFGKGDTSTYDRAKYHTMTDPIGSFHIYVIDWTADAVNWYIDDLTTPVRTLTYSDPLAHSGTRYPQTPMKIKMGNWVGCPDASDPTIAGTCSWAGGQAVFPGSYSMYVQSVEIVDYGCGSTYSYGDMTGSWQSITGTTDCTGKSSGSSSSSSSPPSSSTSTTSSKGGIFAGTSTSTSSSAGSSSTGSGSGSQSSSTVTTSSVAGQTTLPSSTLSSSTKKSSSTSTSSTPAAATNTNAAGKTKFGAIEYSVIALGVGLGYLVM